MKKFYKLLLILILFSNTCFADRIKDITSLAGIRSNQLVGYGIVVGLAGTGDGNTGITLQSMQSLVARFGITSGVDGFNGVVRRDLSCILPDILFSQRSVERRCWNQHKKLIFLGQTVDGGFPVFDLYQPDGFISGYSETDAIYPAKRFGI